MAKQRRGSRKLLIRHGVHDANSKLNKAKSRLDALLNHGGITEKSKKVNPERLAEDFMVLGDFYSKKSESLRGSGNMQEQMRGKEMRGNAIGSYKSAQIVANHSELPGYENIESKLESLGYQNPPISRTGVASIIAGLFLTVGNITGNVVGVSNVSYTGAALFLLGLLIIAISYFKNK